MDFCTSIYSIEIIQIQYNNLNLTIQSSNKKHDEYKERSLNRQTWVGGRKTNQLVIPILHIFMFNAGNVYLIKKRYR